MDPNHRVEADQLPSENDIERLFPKCPPKQQYNGGGGGANNWRHHHQQSNSRSSNGRQQLQPRQYRRRANRSRAPQNHQQAAEAGAARNSKDNSMKLDHGSSASSYANNNGNIHTNNSKQQLQRANQTDSSDNENVSSKSKRITQMRKSSSSVIESGGLDATTTNSSGATTRTSNGNGKKRASKYMASQSLLQQWQRSSQSNQKLGNSGPMQQSLQQITSRETTTTSKSNKQQHDDDNKSNLQKSKSIDGFNTTAAAAQQNNTGGLDTRRAINRTSRGVVFAKPIERSATLDLLQQENSLTSINNNNNGRHQNPLLAMTTTNANQCGQINASLSGANATAASHDPSTQQTADANDTTQQAIILQDIEDNNSIVNKTNQQDSTLINNINFKHNNNSKPREILETNNQFEQQEKNENGKDKYIDLFVYDNAPSSSADSHQLQKRYLGLNYVAEPVNHRFKKQPSTKFHDSQEDRAQDLNSLASTKAEHLANHQLLTDFDHSENDESTIIRNDTSTEELCYTSKNPDELLNEPPSRQTTIERSNAIRLVQDQENPKRTSKDIVAVIKTNTSTTTGSNHHRSSLGSLQPVDEKAELSVSDETTTTGVCCDIDYKPKLLNDCEPKIELLDIGDSEMQTSANNNNTNHLIKKGFVPPGFPQRVTNINRTAPSDPVSSHQLSQGCRTATTAKQTTSLEKPQTDSNTSGGTSSLHQQQTIEKHENIGLTSHINTKLLTQSVQYPNPTVDNVSDDQQQDDANQHTNDSTLDRSHALITNPRHQRGEHAPQMPSISEDQSECENQEVAGSMGGEIHLSSDHVVNSNDLSIGLDKITLDNTELQHRKIDNNEQAEETEEAPIWSPQQQSCQEVVVSTNITTTHSANSDYTQHGGHSGETSRLNHKSNQLPQVVDTQQSDDFICLDSTSQGLNLRHHRLPNETSHYSIVKSTTNKNPTAINSLIQTSASNPSPVPLKLSSTQSFNTLSDGESEPDELAPSNLQHTPSPPLSQINKANHSLTGGAENQSFNHLTNKRSCDPSTGPHHSSLVALKLDDDLMPGTKTALIFPRLDEGLSSDAESCEDEVEEDDDRAMEADVDADDDEDDDDDVEDDIDHPNLLVDRALQSSVDSFIRQHAHSQQAMKPQNRLVGSIQQHSNNSAALDQANIYPAAKSSSGYMNQHDPSVDQNDAKTLSSYSNQTNGRPVHWMGLSSQQANVVSSQITPSNQQYSIQRNTTQNSSNSNSANSNLPRASVGQSAGVGLDNGSYGCDEAKTSNRLSSDTDNETDRLLGPQRADQMQKLSNNNDLSSSNSTTDIQPINNYVKQNSNSREVLIEGVLFNVKYLGSTHTDCEGRGEKEDRIHQAEMAVHEVKFRNGESQTATEVQLFVSTEKIMVLDDKHRKIMMDHSLRTISYIADIGDAIVLIVRKKNASVDATNELGRPISKISCHVFESSESHTITKSISQAFQVAYTELLKANGAGDAANYLPKELDYQEVLNSQEMSTAELEMFARKDNQREVIVPKKEGEILGLSIVESGWGSVLPTAVIASLKQDGPAYRCKKLTVGDQILSINGISLVGLSLPECQEILRKTKHQRVARLSVVPCPITVEVKIKRPDTKYQLGFSVQNGVICSLLRGGIAERGGVRVGHRIMSINGTTVVGVPHDKIVTLLASSVGEIRMKTCLTSLYRHMLGEEKAVFL